MELIDRRDQNTHTCKKRKLCYALLKNARNVFVKIPQRENKERGTLLSWVCVILRVYYL